jgi:hypothetical protein
MIWKAWTIAMPCFVEHVIAAFLIMSQRPRIHMSPATAPSVSGRKEKSMLRSAIGGLACLLVCNGMLAADEVKGKIKTMDQEQMALTVTDDEGKDHVINLDKETKVRGPNGLVQKDGLKSPRLKPGVAVTIACETRDGKPVCTEIRIVRKPKKETPGTGMDKDKGKDKDKP